MPRLEAQLQHHGVLPAQIPSTFRIYGKIEELLLFPDSMPFSKLPLLNMHFFREGVICINFVPL